MFKLSQAKQDKLRLEVDYQYSRSSGPGGQKVNKTESRAELFWALEQTNLFNEGQVERLKQKLKHRLSKEGFVIFYSDQHRSRQQNKESCFLNFVEALEKALTLPKVRKKTKPTRASVERRIEAKKRLSDKKKNRQKW